ncbi:MAG: hypothetical protein WBX50_04185, partial [Candidatus Deferrimicrobiaceae bacterium]
MEAERHSLCPEDLLLFASEGPGPFRASDRSCFPVETIPHATQEIPYIVSWTHEFRNGRDMSENRRNNTVTRGVAFRYWMLSLFSTAYLFLFLRILWRVGDEGLVVYGAQRVVEGALPYRDFVEVFGPASFYWHALFFSLLGTKWMVARGVLLFTGATSAVLVYWMTRRLYRGPFEMMPALYSL